MSILPVRFRKTRRTPSAHLLTRVLRHLFVLTLVAGGLTACQDDDDGDTPQVSENVLQLDGPHFTEPLLTAGTHRFAVQFFPEDLGATEGKSLEAIRVFLGRPPASMRLSVHEGGETVPGIELTALTRRGSFEIGRFVDYEIDPIAIDENEFLWLVVEVELDIDQQSVGCDRGPRQDGGDWLWSGDGYRTFIERSGENINWNIRGVLR